MNKETEAKKAPEEVPAYILPQGLATVLVNYLIGRPYAEVHELIYHLSNLKPHGSESN